MNIITRILEKLFKLEKENHECLNCDHLRLLIEQERQEKGRLISHIIEITSPREEVSPVQITAPKPIRPRHVPWHIRAQELQALDRKEASIRNEKKEEAESITLKNLEDEIAEVNKEINDANEKAVGKNDAGSNESIEQQEAVS